MTRLAIPLADFVGRLQAACAPLQRPAVEDVLGWYVVGARDGRALSLHLYAGPRDRILLFDEVRGTARRVSL